MEHLQSLGIFCLLILLNGTVIAQKENLINEWVLVEQETKETLIEPTSFVESFNNLAIEEKIKIAKKRIFKSTVIHLFANGKCNYERKGQINNTSYKATESKLTIGSKEWMIQSLTNSTLILKETDFFPSTSKYITREQLTKLSSNQKDSLLTFNQYDSLLIKYVNENKKLKTRKDIYTKVEKQAKVSNSDKLNELLKESLGERYLSESNTDYIGVSIYKTFTIIIEKNGDISNIASEINDVEIYRKLNEVYSSNEIYWTPAEINGYKIAYRKKITIQLKE